MGRSGFPLSVRFRFSAYSNVPGIGGPQGDHRPHDLIGHGAAKGRPLQRHHRCAGNEPQLHEPPPFPAGKPQLRDNAPLPAPQTGKIALHRERPPPDGLLHSMSVPPGGLQIFRAEALRQELPEGVLPGLPLAVETDDFHLRGKFPHHLPAGAAGYAEFLAPARHHDAAEGAVSLADSLEDRRALGAYGAGKGGVFNIAAGIHRAVAALQGSTYRKMGVGNPTAEEIGKGERLKAKGEKNPTITILPGSRPSEVKHCLPKMLEAARRFPDYSITVCAAPGIEDEFYTPYLYAHETLTRDTYASVCEASAAIVNSGTATLETALLGCPQVAVYHLACARFIGAIRRIQPLFFSINHFTPVNILLGKEVIKECIANEFTVENIANELERILQDEAYKKEMLVQYEHLISLLGSQQASVEAAHIITSKP